MTEVLSNQLPETLAELPRPAPLFLLSPTPAPSASASQCAQAPFSDLSPMMNRLSALVHCQRPAPTSAATPIQVSAPPPPSPRPALRHRLGLLAPRQFLWKLGQPATTSDLPAGAGARAAATARWKPRPERPRRRFRPQSRPMV